jgi:hypothetical protein
VEAERSTGALKAGPGRTEANIEAGERGGEVVTVLLTGPFGGLTDDVREFLLCLSDDGLPLTGWGDLDPAGLQLVRRRLPGGGALGDSPEGLALARRRATLLRSLCDAGRLAEERDGALRLTALGREFLDLPAAAQLGFVFAAWWEGVDWGHWAPTAELGRLLWHERDTLLQELAGLPEGQVELGGFARRFRALVGHRWPAVTARAGVADWARALWATALAPLAMLGAVDVPERLAPAPAWFAVTATTPALLAAATAMAGPHSPPSLGISASN